MNILRIRTGRAVALGLVLAAQSAAAQDAAPAGEGRDLYRDYQCWQCHGYEGQGGAAPRVAPTAYPFEAFTRFVRYPNVMPAYTPEMLGDEELRAIYDYLRTMPEPPPVEAIPALSDLGG